MPANTTVAKPTAIHNCSRVRPSGPGAGAADCCAAAAASRRASASSAAALVAAEFPVYTESS